MTIIARFAIVFMLIMNCTDRLAALGAAVPELLLPAPGTDLSKWAVIACDQATQDRRYWEEANAIAGDAPSSLRLIYPEVYLEESGHENRIASIHHNMKRYLETGVFAPPQKTLVYVERDTPYNRARRGLVIALDLEFYDWKPGSAPMIRPTEGTVAERLPARMDIRRNAPLEIPHILILIDDEENALLPALGERAKTAPPIYDTELMLGAGRVKGWKLDDEAAWEMLANGLEKLGGKSEKSNGPKKFSGGSEKSGSEAASFIYAAGDGNHSLAAAKAVWEEYKAAHRGDPGLMSHPARWALVELENLYDPALAFEPIHRLLFGTSAATLRQLLTKLPGYCCRKPGNPAELAALVGDAHCSQLRLGLISGPDCFLVEADPVPLAIDALQPLLDAFVKEQGTKVTIDYIHGTDELFRLAGDSGATRNEGTTGILLPPFRKQGLFETVAKHGPLPRKSFSMGESCEKRFYLESRKLFW